MKIEIEIPVDAFQQSAQKHVDETIARIANGYGALDYINAQIKAQWHSAVDDAIRAALADSPAIKAAVREGIEKKLKAQIVKMMKDETK